MKDEVTLNRGSTWAIWDLHVHTPFSALNNQWGDPDDDATWEKFVDALEAGVKDRGIVALGITDYFSIEGYAKLRDYQESHGRLQNVTLFPNIELRADTFVGQGARRINLHLLFSPAIPPSELEEHVIRDVKFVYERDPYRESSARGITRVNLEEFGAQLQTEHQSFLGRSPYEIGCLNAVVNPEQVEAIVKRRFRGKYLIVLAEQDTSRLDWDGQDHAARKQLLQMSHALFSSNKQTRDFCLGLKSNSPEDFVSEFKSLKPCFWGCDSHGPNDRFLEPDQGRFCWIKGEPTWEGLKQTLYEPEARVSVQAENPEPIKSGFTLDRVTISETEVNDRLRIEATNLAVNANLVAVIGGRGAGKTALLDLIGACFQDGQSQFGNESAFLHRVFRDAESPWKPVPVSLTFVSGDTFSVDVGLVDDTFEKCDVLYLTQNHFDQYSSDPERLNSHIVELLFQANPDGKREHARLTSDVRSREQKIREFNLRLQQITDEIAVWSATEHPVLQELNGRAADLNGQIERTEKELGEQDEETRSLSKERSDLAELKGFYRRVASEIADVRAAVLSFDEVLSGPLAKLEKSAVDSRLADTPVAELNLEGARDAVGGLPEPLALAEESLSELIRDTDSRIEAARERLAELEGRDKELADLRERLAEVEVDLVEAKERMAAIDDKREELLTVEERRNHAFAEMVRLVLSQVELLDQAISGFTSNSAAAMANVGLTARFESTVTAGYVEGVDRLVDGRKLDREALATALSALNGTLAAVADSAPEIPALTEVARRFSNAIDGLPRRTSVSYSELSNAVFSRYFRAGFRIEYHGRTMEKLSMGERAVILLKVLLALDDRPLLIDQPEEHLDNRFIFEDLAPAFREAKQRRQIIIATHNANLVVNTDAEQVIVAESRNGTLSYKVGTLEDLDVREETKSILEGGHDAFVKREEKYGYRF